MQRGDKVFENADLKRRHFYRFTWLFHRPFGNSDFLIATKRFTSVAIVFQSREAHLKKQFLGHGTNINWGYFQIDKLQRGTYHFSNVHFDVFLFLFDLRRNLESKMKQQ